MMCVVLWWLYENCRQCCRAACRASWRTAAAVAVNRRDVRRARLRKDVRADRQVSRQHQKQDSDTSFLTRFSAWEEEESNSGYYVSTRDCERGSACEFCGSCECGLIGNNVDWKSQPGMKKQAHQWANYQLDDRLHTYTQCGISGFFQYSGWLERRRVFWCESRLVGFGLSDSAVSARRSYIR